MSKGEAASGPLARRSDRTAIDQMLARANAKQVPPTYKDRRNAQKLQHRKEEHELRKKVSVLVYGGIGLQLLVVDIVFVLYAWKGRNWDVPVEAIAAWLGATVIEVIGVVLAITRYLFPPRRKP